jgi:tetratricopeptide (TPR) repeat protein
LGTLAIFVLPFGWGKPVLVNIYNFKRPRRDYFLTSLAGPAANAVMVGLCLALMLWTRSSFRFGDGGVAAMEQAHHLLMFIAIINVILATLNLIPVPPLDGSKLWPCVLPGVKPMQRPRTTWLFVIILVVLMYSGSLEPAFKFTVGAAMRLFPESDAEAFVADRLEAGHAAFVDGQWAAAEKSFTEALAVDPQSPANLLGRAMARQRLDNWQGALDDMNQVIALSPRAEVYAYRAMILRALGRVAEAQADEAMAKSLPKIARGDDE